MPLATLLLIALALVPRAGTGPLPVDWQRGVNLTDYSSSGYATPETMRTLKRLRAEGVTDVAVVSTWYQANASSGTISRGPRSPSDAALRTVIEEIQSLGMRAVLKPQIDLLDGAWRGTIAPSAAYNDWWVSYRHFIDHHAQLAEQEGVSMLVVGTELEALTDQPLDTTNWQTTIEGVRAIYSGKLTYAATWDREAAQVGFWPQLDLIGIDAYFPLSTAVDPPVSELNAAWSLEDRVAEVRQLSERIGKPAIFTEIGYPRASRCAERPWQESGLGPPSDVCQANAYQSALQTWSGVPGFDGLYFWDRPATGSGSAFAPGSPAERVMSRWYR